MARLDKALISSYRPKLSITMLLTRQVWPTFVMHYDK